MYNEARYRLPTNDFSGLLLRLGDNEARTALDTPLQLGALIQRRPDPASRPDPTLI